MSELQVQYWPIHDIVPSPFQERRLFHEGPLAEMAASIREAGVIQPLTARRVAVLGPLELVCGERRLRAAKLAELTVVPVMVRALSDADAENIVLLENIQREDLTPTEEARSYARLLSLRDAEGKLMHTRADVARLASKKVTHVDDFLKLLGCPDEVMTAVDAGELSLSVARVVGSIPDPSARPRAAAEIMKPSYQQVPMNYAQAKEHVRTHYMVNLAGVPWGMEDTGLVPVCHEVVEGERARVFGGDCETCPFRSGNIEGVALTQKEGARGKGGAGGSSAMLCTLPRCHRAKIDAVFAAQRVKVLEKGGRVMADAEAKKEFHPSANQLHYNSKFVLLDSVPGYDALGSDSYDNKKKWRALLKGADIKTTHARSPHTGLLVEMALLTEVRAIARAAIKGKPPAAGDDETDASAAAAAKKKRLAELREGKVEAAELGEGLRAIELGVTRAMDAEGMRVLVGMAVRRAGAEGIRFLSKHWNVPKPEKESYDREKPLLAFLAARCEERVLAWQSALVMVLMAQELAWGGLKADGYRALIELLGVDVAALRAAAEAQVPKVKAEKPAKVKKVDAAEKWSADAEAAKTAAADAIAKGKERRAESVPAAKKAAPAKVVKDLGEIVEDWKATAAAGEFDAQVTRAKAGVPWAEIIGAMPAEGTKQRKAWDALRVKIYKAAKKAKGAK